MKLLKKYFTIILCLATVTVFAQKYKKSDNPNIKTTYNGASFQSNKSLLQNLESVKDISIFVKAMETKDVQSQMNAEEMVTVFIFKDSSYSILTKKIKDSLSAYQPAMNNLITYYMVAGRVDSHSLLEQAKSGKTYLSTINGDKLGVRTVNGKIELFDTTGHVAIIEGKDLYYDKGLFHIVNGVVMPGESQL